MPATTRRALLSVSDKTGIVDLARGLADLGFEIVSTGGTAATVVKGGLKVRTVEDLTGFPEILEGRLKTLHPKVFAGILALRDKKDHQAALAKHGLPTFDVVAVNLYPFEQTVARPDATLEEAIEQIDIGGPSLLRAAAKNHRYCVPVCRPGMYAAVLAELREKGDLSLETRQRLAVEALSHTGRYDALISAWLRRRILQDDFPEVLNLSFEKIQGLRYGENSHQRAAFYKSARETREPSVVNARQVHGKELSYNNILDVDTALECAKDFDRPTACIVKHATPCGVASAPTVAEAYRLAFETDTYSPYGGVVGFNRTCDLATAEQMKQLFLEAIVAPQFEREALELLKTKKNVRLIEVAGVDVRGKWGGLTYRGVVGGLLVQDRDIKEPEAAAWKVVSKRQPTEDEMRSMVFAFKAVRHVRSNSVVFVRDEHTVAIGGGQTARVDATWIATRKGGERIRGSVMASDAFFPFRDGVDVAAEAGVVAIVHPGGSIRDAEVIQAADEHDIAMVFTGQRCFRH